MTKNICEICGKKISKARLKALPNTKICIKCSAKYGSDCSDIIDNQKILNDYNSREVYPR